jgi:hypothetical protein
VNGYDFRLNIEGKIYNITGLAEIDTPMRRSGLQITSERVRV